MFTLSNTLRAVAAALAVLLAPPARPLAHSDAPPLRLPVVGSMGGVRLYEELEVAFWRDRLPQLSGGTARADLTPSDRSGIRGQDMLHMIRLGVVSFGTVPLGLAANDEPELAAPDLAMLAPDIGTLRRIVQAYRPHLATVLRQQYGAELLAVYAYPAQVLFCAEPLPELEALRGRRVRVSQSSQADMVEALGGRPLQLPYAQLRADLADGRTDCVITGSAGGHRLGLPEVTAQVHGMAVSWGLSVFAANGQAWAALPESLKPVLRRGLAGLEQETWTAAAQDTEDGLRCSAGREGCRGGTPGRLRWEPVSATDEAVRRRLLAETVVPGWVARCGEECRLAWNSFLAPMTRIFLPPEGAPPPQPRVVPWELPLEAGSQAVTGLLPVSMMLPAWSSTSSR